MGETNKLKDGKLSKKISKTSDPRRSLQSRIRNIQLNVKMLQPFGNVGELGLLSSVYLLLLSEFVIGSYAVMKMMTMKEKTKTKLPIRRRETHKKKQIYFFFCFKYYPRDNIFLILFLKPFLYRSCWYIYFFSFIPC